MSFALAGPELWNATLAECGRGTDIDRNAALALLRLAHSSGFGVPIGLCFEFTGWIAGQPTQDRFWDGVFRAILAERLGGRAIATKADVLARLRRSPFDAISVFFFPVISHVLSCCDSNVLYVDGASSGADNVGRVHEIHLTNFERILSEISEEPGGAFAKDAPGVAELADKEPSAKRADRHSAFKLSMALQLAQFAGHPARPKDHAEPVDQQAASLFAAACAEFTMQRPRWTAHIQPASSKIRQIARMRIDGARGVRHASPSEDPSSMIPSQLVYPFEFLVERIENEGFLAFDRPPPVPPNQTLVFLAMPEGFADTPGLSVLRAAWWMLGQCAHSFLDSNRTRLHLLWMSRFAGFPGRDTVTWSSDAMSNRRSANAPLADFIASFQNQGAPFLLSLNSGAAGNSPARGVGEPLFQSLLNHDVDVAIDAKNKTRVLALAGSTIESNLDRLREEILALDANSYAVVDFALTKDSRGQEKISLANRDAQIVPNDFGEQVALVHRLVEALLREFHEVWTHG